LKGFVRHLQKASQAAVDIPMERLENFMTFHLGGDDELAIVYRVIASTLHLQETRRISENFPTDVIFNGDLLEIYLLE
jgi:hypothetical protein